MSISTTPDPEPEPMPSYTPDMAYEDRYAMEDEPPSEPYVDDDPVDLYGGGDDLYNWEYMEGDQGEW